MKRSHQPARIVLTPRCLPCSRSAQSRPWWRRKALPASGENVSTVAVITPGAKTNLGWDQQAVDSMNAVGAKLGIAVQIAENAGYEDITPALKDLADEGAQLIICHASGYQTPCPDFAQRKTSTSRC